MSNSTGTSATHTTNCLYPQTLVCMYVCVCVCMCVCMYVCAYVWWHQLSIDWLIRFSPTHPFTLQSQCAPSFHRPSIPHKPTSDNSAANKAIVIQGSNNEHAYLHANRVAAILREGFFVETASLEQWSPSTLVSLHVHKIISSEWTS